MDIRDDSDWSSHILPNFVFFSSPRTEYVEQPKTLVPTKGHFWNIVKYLSTIVWTVTQFGKFVNGEIYWNLIFCTYCAFLFIIYYLHEKMHVYIKLLIILQMLLHVSVLLHHPHGAYILCLIKLWNIRIVKITWILIFYNFNEYNIWAPWRWSRVTETRKSVCNRINVSTYMYICWYK